MAAEHASHPDFLTYAHHLNDRNSLDRVFVDEAHLTWTQSHFRHAMTALGQNIRQVPAKTVWLTATLPPRMWDDFKQHNRLWSPRLFRGATNRQNIEYNVSYCQDFDLDGSFFDWACGTMTDGVDQACTTYLDKGIIYCQTKQIASDVGEQLGCYVLTSATEDKAVTLGKWLSDPDMPLLAATSALSVGFDYAHVRIVYHLGCPHSMTDLVQESGRAGRDGQFATSTVLLDKDWDTNESLASANRRQMSDKRALKAYLDLSVCRRTIIACYLDGENRACSTDDVICDNCHDLDCLQGRATDDAYEAVNFRIDNRGVEPVYTGPTAVMEQFLLEQRALETYMQGVRLYKDCCLYCRGMNRDHLHLAANCTMKMDWVRPKVQLVCEGRWLAPYSACFTCYQPQTVCRKQADGELRRECEFPDMLIPFLYGIYHRPGGIRRLEITFDECFSDDRDYLKWVATPITMAGTSCIMGVKVAAFAFAEYFEGSTEWLTDLGPPVCSPEGPTTAKGPASSSAPSRTESTTKALDLLAKAPESQDLWTADSSFLADELDADLGPWVPTTDNRPPPEARRLSSPLPRTREEPMAFPMEDDCDGEVDLFAGINCTEEAMSPAAPPPMSEDGAAEVDGTSWVDLTDNFPPPATDEPLPGPLRTSEERVDESMEDCYGEIDLTSWVHSTEDFAPAPTVEPMSAPPRTLEEPVDETMADFPRSPIPQPALQPQRTPQFDEGTRPSTSKGELRSSKLGTRCGILGRPGDEPRFAGRPSRSAGVDEIVEDGKQALVPRPPH